jgi:hypothetical protein
LSQRIAAVEGSLESEVIPMAHAVTAPTAELPATHDTHHGLPSFAVPMLVLFGTYVAWLLVAAIVLYIVA